MYEYSRAVFYYETDQMGVVHHSNVIRWFEEARIGFLASIGIPYEAFEAGGVLSPIIGVNVNYKLFARFGDTFTIRLKMTKYTGIRFSISYTVVNQKGELLSTGESDHAFLGLNYRPVNLKRTMPHLHEVLSIQLEE